MGKWEIVVWGDQFTKFLRKLKSEDQLVLKAALDFVLAEHGVGICESEWGKPLGGGLYEFRVRRAPARPGEVAIHKAVLFRIFCTFTSGRIVILLSAYDKGRDNSRGRQQREINHARKILTEYRSQGLRDIHLNA